MYRLECSLCDLSFRTRVEWHEHLLQARHQAELRAKGLRLLKKCRVRALVLFAKFPLACREVLEYFSTADNPIVEFLWWAGVPGFVVLIFESREQAKNAFVSVKGPKVIIHENPVEIRKAFKYLEMEWEHLLPPPGLKRNIGKRRRCDIVRTSKGKKMKTDDLSCTNGIPPVVQEVTLQNPNLYDSNENGEDVGGEDIEVVEHESEEIEAETVDLADDEDELELELEVTSAGTEQSVSRIEAEFQEMFNQLKISDERFQTAKKLQVDITEIIRKSHPNCRLYMFRHWYLGIKSSGTNELILVVDYLGHLEGRVGRRFKNTQKDPPPNLVDILRSDSAQAAIPGLRPITPSTNTMNPSEPGGTVFLHEPSGLHLNLVMGDEYLNEAQACRFLEYLCEFDPRVRPLLSLVIYRARLNKIRISPATSKMPFSGARFNSSEPTALEWLVIFFLCQRGLIPTPRQLCLTGGKFFMPKNLSVSNVTLSKGSNVLQTWLRTSSSTNLQTDPNDFYWSVLELARDFFEFYAALGSDSFVLNTTDAEIYPRSQCREDSGASKNRKPKKYVTVKAFVLLSTLQRRCLRKGPLKDFMCLEKRRILILHPLNFSTHLDLRYPQFEESLIWAKYHEEKLTDLLAQRREETELNFLPFLHFFMSWGKLCKVKISELRRKIMEGRTIIADAMMRQELQLEQLVISGKVPKKNCKIWLAHKSWLSSKGA